MCLHKKSRKRPPVEGEAWKIFRRKTPTAPYEFQYKRWNSKREVPVGRWITASKIEISPKIGTSYKSGFHLFVEEPPAWWLEEDVSHLLVARKVKYRSGHTLGSQVYYPENGDSFHLEIIVADEIFVPNPKPRTKAKGVK